MTFALMHAAGLAALASLFYATGYLLQTVIRGLEIAALGTVVVRIALGTIVWMYLLFGFASVGWFRALPVLPFAFAVLATAVARVALLPEAGPRAWLRRLRAGPDQLSRVVQGFFLGVVPALILSAIFVHTLSLRIGWDDDTYHLTLPKLYLAHGGFRRIAFNVYSHWPHNVELLFGLAMMLHDYVLAKLLHTLFLALVVVAVFRLSRQHASGGAALLGSLLVLGNDVVLFEAERAYIDIAFAFFFLAAIAGAVEFSREGRGRALVMSGVCCGTLAGTKLSGLAGLACVLVLVLSARPLRLGHERLIFVAARLGLPTLLLALPWYAKSYLYTGDPLYPFLSRHAGGSEWSASLGQQFFDWQRSIGMGRSLLDYLALPLRVVRDGGRGYDHFGAQVGMFWLLAVPLSMAVSFRSRVVRPYLLCAGAYFVLWAFSSQQTRFLIAVLPPLAIATALSVDWIANHIPAGNGRRSFWLMLAIGACVALVPSFQPSLERALDEAKNLVSHGPADRSSVIPEGYAFIDAKTAPDATIMLLNTNHGFFLDREYIADSFFEASQMNAVLSKARSADDLSAILRRLGVTHLYVSQAGWGISYPRLLWRFLRDPRRARLAYQCRQKNCSLYQLQTSGI
jgi:hypothetical protein